MKNQIISYIKELRKNSHYDNKIILNKKNDNLLTFGNESGNKSNNNDSNIKNYIINLKKETENLKYQLNKKNEKINILQQKIENLLLNDNSNDYLKIELINNLKNMEEDHSDLHISGSSQNNTINANKSIKQCMNILLSKGNSVNNKNKNYIISSPNSFIKEIRRTKQSNNNYHIEFNNQIKNDLC